MKTSFICALLLSAASGIDIPQSNQDADTDPLDENLSGLLSSALAGAKPGIIKEPTHLKTDKEQQKQVTKGYSKNYKFHWEYSCAFTKWIPSNQFMHANKVYDAATMTLERFGFIGMDKKCFWGMVGVEWITPLKINQILPGTNKPVPKPTPKPKPKPTPPKPKPTPPKPITDLRASKFMTAAQQAQIAGMFPASAKFRILWIGDVDGWSAKDFGSRVFKKGKTITIIQTTGGKFIGAYMGFPIDPKGKASGGHKSFVFYGRHNKLYKLANKPGKDEIYQLAKEPLHMSYGLHLHPGCKSNYVSNLGLATYGSYYLPKAAAKNNYVAGFYVLGKKDTKQGKDTIRVHFKCQYAETYLVE